nr:prolipoprotein diacylglyceryl transferase [Planctomycetota bacterium]
MRPVIFELFGLPIHGYGLMIVLGYLLTVYMATRIVRKWELEDVFYDLSMVMLLSGILGGRTMFYILNYSAEFQDRSPFAFFKIWEGGLVLYGGVTGGCLGGLIYMSWKKLSVLDYMDVSGIVAPIGLAFGRLGCFMNGCC